MLLQESLLVPWQSQWPDPYCGRIVMEITIYTNCGKRVLWNNAYYF